MSENGTIDGWAVLELMGHRRLAGYVVESEVAGQGMLRIDVPENLHAPCECSANDKHALLHDEGCPCTLTGAPQDVAATQFYSPGAVYCLTPTTEQIARGLAQRLLPTPVHRFELPAPVEPVLTPAPVCDTCGHALGLHSVVEPNGCAPCTHLECDCEDYDGIPF